MFNHFKTIAAAAALGLAAFASPASAQEGSSLLASLFQKPDFRTQRAAPAQTREVVAAPQGYAAGTILVDTPNRALYLIGDNGTAMRYAIGVARAGFEWGGDMHIGRKAEWPSWTPPAEMLKRRPDLPKFMAGGEANPLGARAMYLYNASGSDSIFRIHGTNEEETIGEAVSSGCIRMMNNDVIDLYSRVKVGTRVVVLRDGRNGSAWAMAKRSKF
ncbi:L,D-transpeptidase [Terrarubrum flagellatum]|uniref:L,D-transpeptidase n=1 Tax=Terrirubrum flagellatum TaxID=2895980 RepID=UPI00314512AA